MKSVVNDEYLIIDCCFVFVVVSFLVVRWRREWWSLWEEGRLLYRKSVLLANTPMAPKKPLTTKPASIRAIPVKHPV